MKHPAIEKTYDQCRYLLFRLEDYRNGFRNEFATKDNISKDIHSEIEEEIKTIVADVYILSELLFNIQNAETEEDIIQIIRDRENNKDNKNVLV
jgi:threonyl-tRNA synthetase